MIILTLTRKKIKIKPMKKKIVILLFLFIHLVSFAFCNYSKDENTLKAENTFQQENRIPRFFTQNNGQITDQNHQKNNDVLFLLNGTEFNVQLRKSGFSYDLYQHIFEEDLNVEENGLTEGKKTILKEVNYHRIDFEFLGYNKDFKVISEVAASAFTINYYSNEGLINAKNFSKVTYKDIYKNIDVEFITDDVNGFKYNFIIHPGGNINDIAIQLKGADQMKMGSDNLIFETSLGSLIENIPYSEIVETKEKVNVRLVLTDQQLHFETNTPISGKTLLIDPYPTPTVRWGTYVGGEGSEYAGGSRSDIDGSNNIYIVGLTTSATGIATAGAFQSTLKGSTNGFIAKFNIAGVIQWATYFSSGAAGTANTELYNIEISGSDMYVVGKAQGGLYTTAGVHQTTFAGGFADGWIAKMDLNGNVVWSTYYGGSANDEINTIINPATGRLFISGTTYSSDGISTPGVFQTTFAGVRDIFVAEFNANNGARVWGSYYGGSDVDRDRGIAYSSAYGGSLLFLGNTKSTNVNLASPGSYISTKPGSGTNDDDGLIVSLSDNGVTRNWSTYIGSVGADYMEAALLVLPNGDFYFGTRMTNTNLPGFVTPGTFINTYTPDIDQSGVVGYAAKFSSSGNKLIATYVPGQIASITLNDYQDLIFTGQTSQNGVIGLTVTANALYTTGTFSSNYVCITENDFSTLLYGTLFGNPNADLPSTVISLPLNNFYVSGYTQGNDPVGPDQIATAGANKVDAQGLDYYTMLICNSQVEITNPEPLYYVNGLNLTASNGFASYSWSGQATGSGQNFSITQAGIYYLTGTDYAGCSSKDTIEVLQPIIVPTATISGGGTICSGDTSPDVTIDLTGTAPWTITYTVNGVPTTVSSITTSPFVISNGVEGFYEITGLTDGTNNTGTFNGNATITINDPVVPDFTTVSPICSGASIAPLPTVSNNGISGLWSPALNNTATTTYTFTPNPGTCATEATMTITVNPNTTPTFDAIPAICQGESLTALPTTSLNGISGTWTPPLNNSVTTTYTFTPVPGVCATTEMMIITVNPLPSIDAGQDVSIGIGESVSLTATATGTISWNNGENTNIIEVSPNQTTEYCATVTDGNSCTNSDCINVFVVESCNELFVPTAFSPNNDGNNDVLFVLGNCITDFDLMIFDRWGEMVFKSNSQNTGWDGSFKGKKLDPAVFVYTLHATVNGVEISREGNISIIK